MEKNMETTNPKPYTLSGLYLFACLPGGGLDLGGSGFGAFGV